MKKMILKFYLKHGTLLSAMCDMFRSLTIKCLILTMILPLLNIIIFNSVTTETLIALIIATMVFAIISNLLETPIFVKEYKRKHKR